MQRKQLVLPNLDGFDFKGRLRWGFLLSVLLSVFGSFHPTPSVLCDSRPSTHRLLLMTGSNSYPSASTKSLVPGKKVLALALRGGSEEMGLSVQSQGSVDLVAIVPALMSTDNSVRSEAEVM